MQASNGAASAARAGAAAVAFLTRVPIGRRLFLAADDVGRGAVLFPVVGAGLGALVGLVAIGLDAILPPLLAAGLALVLEVLLTGAIHLDALADAADGLGASSGGRALEIMREPSIGAFGAVALVLDLLVKAAALAALLGSWRALPLVVAAWAAGRTAPLVLAWALPYARPGGGSGRALTDSARRTWLAIGLALGVGTAVAAAGTSSPALLLGAAIAVVAVGLTARARLGGVTGDVLGAGAELATTLGLVGAVTAA
jgi:adenosylcobinamide-GDP ribazoletransferase